MIAERVIHLRSFGGKLYWNCVTQFGCWSEESLIGKCEKLPAMHGLRLYGKNVRIVKILLYGFSKMFQLFLVEFKKGLEMIPNMIRG